MERSCLPTGRVILHIDFDSFFASVEQQKNPAFRGKPLGVTATNGRTCIIASSREAKQLGIKTGTRTFDAQKICPQIILVPSDFILYWEVSQKFIAICKDFTPYLEVFSIDEIFMDITKTSHLFGGTTRLIYILKKRIVREIGPFITVSIGISHNKLLAKLASGLRKPNGIVRINPHEIVSIYRTCALTDICGIGNRINARLNTMGIYRLSQLQQAPLWCLIAEFGNVEGRFLYNVGRGIDESAVIPYTVLPTVKSVGRNYCLPRNEYNKRRVFQNIFELCEEIGIKLRRLKKKARTVGIYLHGNIAVSGRHTYKMYFDSGPEIFQNCLHILRSQLFSHSEDPEQARMTSGFYRHSGEERMRRLQNLWTSQDDGRYYVRQIGIWVGNLEDRAYVPLALFDAQGKDAMLKHVIDAINKKFGDHTIRRGFLLYAEKLTTVPNGYMADKYERTKLANIGSSNP